MRQSKIWSSIFHKRRKASLQWRRSSGAQRLWRRWCVTNWDSSRVSFFIHTAQLSSPYMRLNRTTALRVSTCGGAASTQLGTTWNVKMPTWMVTKTRVLKEIPVKEMSGPPGLPTAILSGLFWLRGTSQCRSCCKSIRAPSNPL